jgi:hypothetical protein
VLIVPPWPQYQFLQPSSDATLDSWTDQAGGTSNIFTSIDEAAPPNDADYVQSPVAPVTSNFYETLLGSGSSPQSGNQTIRYRYRSTLGTQDLVIGLYDGATLIASWEDTAAPLVFTTASQILTSGQMASITGWTNLRIRFTPNQTATGTERLAPDAILAATSNLSGPVGNIQDDPTNPDANKLSAVSTTAISVLAVSTPTPAFSNPVVGAGLQTFRAWVNKAGGSGTPTAKIDLYESGVFVANILAATNITSTTGQLIQGTWNASLLGTASGANVEIRITGTVGGTGGARATIEVGAVDWLATENGRVQISWADFEIPAAAAAPFATGEAWGLVQV